VPSKYEFFDRSRLRLLPLAERIHDLDASCVMDLSLPEEIDPALAEVGARLVRARERGASRMLFMGAHVIRSGVQRHVLDLMERGLVSCLCGNGACAIHDFELALIGATTESVARYVTSGQFGLWAETGELNRIAVQAAEEGLGFGEAIGRTILEGDFPHKDLSLLAQAYRLGVPFTLHVGIGSDIVHEHPNCDGAAVGRASYADFLIAARAVEGLEGGVVMNFGSAVMGPEIFLKALAMARNAALAEGGRIADFTALVCDLAPLPESYRSEASKNSAQYYFRPWKTMLVRTVADGGESFYVQGRHARTIPQLRAACLAADRAENG